MNIQISVIIWTVICFILLVIILHNLLFKPVLEVIDKRKRRIELAALKKAEEERLLAEIEQKKHDCQAECLARQKESVKAEIEKIHADSKKAVEEAKNNRLTEVERYREKSEKEHEEIVSSVSESAKEIAAAFAEKIISQ
ncbi:MAG: hypothetical protein IJZ90_03245 [Clostridia bacterium]|nr:hypothetical protein [Clostridia bacterium]